MIRQDLFKIIDVLCVGFGQTVGIQCTSRDNISSRIKKMADSEAIADLRDADWQLLVHGWKKPKHRWELREVDIS